MNNIRYYLIAIVIFSSAMISYSMGAISPAMVVGKWAKVSQKTHYHFESGKDTTKTEKEGPDFYWDFSKDGKLQMTEGGVSVANTYVIQGNNLIVSGITFDDVDTFQIQKLTASEMVIFNKKDMEGVVKMELTYTFKK